MKRYVRVIIDGTEADIDASTLSLSLDIAVDTGQPGTVRGSFSKVPVRLPGTKTNRATFEDSQAGTTVISTAHNLLPVTVEANGLPVLAGRLQLTEAVFRGQRGQVTEYRAAVYGNNADWFSQIKNKRIRDLGWATVSLDRAALESAGSNTWTDEHATGLVKWRSWERADSMHHLEHSICLFVKWIVYEAFRELGYRLAGDFLETDLFERLVIPIPIVPYSGDFAEEVVNARVTGPGTQLIEHLAGTDTYTLVLDDDSTFPNFDAGSNFNTGTYTYTVPANGYYQFTYGITFALSSGTPDPSDEYQVRVTVNGGLEFFLTATAGGAYFAESTWLELTAGDTMQLIFQASTAADVDVTVTDLFLEIDYEKRDVLEGETLQLSYLIPPAWTVKDVILDLQKTFGLVIDTDPAAGVVTIEPRDRYTLRERYPTPTETNYEGYYYTSSAEDITGKIDRSRDSVMQVITDYSRYLVMDYATDDETVSSLQETEAYRLYGARYDFGANRFPAGERVESTDFFVKTFQAYDSDIAASSSSAIPYLPVIYDSDYRRDTSAASIPDDYGAHLLYLAGRRGGLDGLVNIYNTGTSATSAYDYPCLFMFNPLDPSGYDPSLAFSNETTNTGTEVPGLMQRFHLRHLSRIEGGRRFEHWIKWDEVDVSTLSFRYKRQIDSGNYLLMQVDGYNPLTSTPTKTVLLKDEPPTSTQAAKITQALLATSDTVTGGSGGSGGTASGGGTGSGGGTAYRPYQQEFPAQASTTMTVTANSGVIPTNKAQIQVWDVSNGQIIGPALYSVSGSDIVLAFSPGGYDYVVTFWI